jgi:uncharacterized protein YndB with AHSA1/START domain
MTEMEETSSNFGRVIHVQAVLRTSAAEGFRHFTDPELLASWLGDRAEVEPVPGGKYEIHWASPPAPPNRGTTGCRVTVLVPEKLLGFDWIGPDMYERSMNASDPWTHVTVTFAPRGETETEVHLVHSGWGNSSEWEEARRWFEQAWSGALQGLAAKLG